MEQAKRRPGRPPVERRRIQMAMRITPELRDELLKRAEATGRSITQEMELLLQQGLATEQLLSGALRHANITMVATFEHAGKAAALGRLENSDPATWLRDPGCYRNALAHVVMAMLEAGPEGLSQESAMALFRWIDARLMSRALSGFIPDEEAPQ